MVTKQQVCVKNLYMWVSGDESAVVAYKVTPPVVMTPTKWVPHVHLCHWSSGVCTY